MEEVCSAAHLADRCNTHILYPPGSLHPAANPVQGLTPPASAPVTWAHLPEDLLFVGAGRSDYVGVLALSALTLRSTRGALRGRVPVPEEVVAAFTFGSDLELERLWKDRSLSQALGVPVVAPAFSTWLDTPPYEHLVQSVRTLAMATQLSLTNAVIPSIPLSPWVKASMWGSALAGAREVAIDIGGISRALWQRYLGVLASLADDFDPTPRLVVYGVRSRGRLKDLIRQWPGRLAFASRAPIDYARKGERLQYPSLQPSKDWNYDRQALAVENDTTFRAVVEDLIEQVWQERHA